MSCRALTACCGPAVVHSTQGKGSHLCINVARRNRDDSRVVQISTTLRRSAMLLTVVGRCTTFNGRQRVQSDCRLHISSTACAHAHNSVGKSLTPPLGQMDLNPYEPSSENFPAPISRRRRSKSM